MTSAKRDGPNAVKGKRPGVRLIRNNQGCPRLWPSIPAVAVGVGGLVLAIALSLGAGSGGIKARYETDASLALSAGDYPTARVCFQRLLQLSPGDPHFQYGLALSLRGMGPKIVFPSRARDEALSKEELRTNR